jgi:hypothetical protein
MTVLYNLEQRLSTKGDEVSSERLNITAYQYMTCQQQIRERVRISHSLTHQPFDMNFIDSFFGFYNSNHGPYCRCAACGAWGIGWDIG